VKITTVFNPPAGPLPANYKWLILFCAALSMSQGAINMSATIISLPDIARDLRLEIASAVWVVTGFGLIVTAFASSFARVSDIYGREKVFTIGLLLYVAASLFCAFSQTGEQLIVARMLLGAAYGISWSTSTPLITDAFPPHQRGRALSMGILTITAGTMFGLVVGGVFTEIFSWRAVFFMTLPITFLALLPALFFLREIGERQLNQNLDIPGTILWSAGMGLLLLGLTYVTRAEWDSTRTHLAFAAGGAVLLVFFVIEPRVKQPMMDLTLFRDKVFANANAASVLSILGTSVIPLMIGAFYFQGFKHYSALETGVRLIPASLVFLVFAPLGGYLTDRIGVKLPSLGGLFLAAGGMLWLAALDSSASYTMVIAAVCFTQMGGALFSGPNTTAILTSAPAVKRAMAGGIRATTFNAGLALSSAMAVAIMATQIPQSTLNQVLGGRSPLGPEDAGILFDGFRLVFLVGFGFTVLGFFTTLLLKEERLSATARPVTPPLPVEASSSEA